MLAVWSTVPVGFKWCVQALCTLYNKTQAFCMLYYRWCDFSSLHLDMCQVDAKLVYSLISTWPSISHEPLKLDKSDTATYQTYIRLWLQCVTPIQFNDKDSGCEVRAELQYEQIGVCNTVQEASYTQTWLVRYFCLQQWNNRNGMACSWCPQWQNFRKGG